MFRAYALLVACLVAFGYLLRDAGGAGTAAAFALALVVYRWAGERWDTD